MSQEKEDKFFGIEKKYWKAAGVGILAFAVMALLL